MSNFSAISTEVYAIMRSFDYQMTIYDDKSNRVFEPDSARKFFGVKTKGEKKESVLVTVDDLNSCSTLQLNLGPSSDASALKGLWSSLKACANKYNIIYKLVVHEKEIQPRDFAAPAMMETKMIDLTENMYGTSRSSYLRIGEAKMVVRHKKPIDDAIVGARSRAVESIFVENAQGERYLMPGTDLAAGRAMAQHVNQGGHWSDQVADQINNMASMYSDLGASISYLNSAVICESLGDLKGMCRTKRKSIRETLDRLYRAESYTEALSSLEDPMPLVESSFMEDIREKLTQEGKRLPDRVVAACSRVMAEGKTDMINEEKNNKEVLRLLGREVDKQAFDDLMQGGNLEMTGTLSDDNLPHFQNLTAEVMYRFSKVAANVRDNSLSNFFTVAYEKYIDGDLDRNDKLRTSVLKVATQALRAANFMPSLNEGLGPRLEAILEMEAWFEQFTPESALNRPVVEAEEEEDCEPDCETEEVSEALAKEDIILPKDPGLDLKDEILAQPEDEEELNRILTLSGRGAKTL